MYNPIVFIREECDRRGIAVSTLEKRCGFSNGYLNPKKITKMPYDRALAVAKEFGMSVEQLLTGEEEKEKPIPEDELDRALYEKLLKLSPEEAARASAFIDGMIANRK